MSSDSDSSPKPTKRHRQIVSDSDNSDDSLIIRNRGKRRVGRVVSDGDFSDNDSDIPLRSIQKRKNHQIIVEDESSSESSSNEENVTTNFDGGSTTSEWQLDWESNDESESESFGQTCQTKCQKSTDINQAKISDSENSDGESDKCPICLLSFRKQEVANPATCDHYFCIDCIIEWSKNINTCPVDRQTFTVINVRDKIGGKIIRHMPVEIKNPTDDSVQEDPTYCEICQRCDREDRMLLCDGCDSGYHLECLDPPMDEVPTEEHWYCPECSRNSQNDAETIEIDLDEVPDLMEEARLLGLSYGRSRAHLVAQGLVSDNPRRRSNLLPRTRQAERVRANVRADRRRRAAVEAGVESFRRDQTQPSTSSGFESISENSRGRSPVPGPSSSRRVTSRQSRTTIAKRPVKRKKQQQRKKIKRKSRKSKQNEEMREVRITEVNENGDLEEIVTYVRASTAGGSGTAPSGRRRKKRKKLRRRVRTVASVTAAANLAKRRLSAQLKLRSFSLKSGSGIAIPILKSESAPATTNAAIRVARHMAGVPQVSLFGGGLGLDYSPPGSDDEYEDTSGGPALLSRNRPAAMTATRRRMALKGAIAQPSIPQSTQSVDILSSILNSQEIWHSKKSKITLTSSGTLLIDTPKKLAENNNNTSPIKLKLDSNEFSLKDDKPLDLTNISPDYLMQQAPMYNNTRGGNRGGNYRGGGYRDNNRHSHGGNSGNYNSGGGNDSYSGSGGGRHSYGGSSNIPQDFSTGGANYSQNFNHRNIPHQQSPNMNMPPPFRGRNPQNFRNRFPPPQFHPNERLSGGPSNQSTQSGSHFQDQFVRPRIPPPPPPLSLRMPLIQSETRRRQGTDGSNVPGNFDSQKFNQNQSNLSDNRFVDEDYGMYDDLDIPTRKPDGGSNAGREQESDDMLAPPPEPPTDLLDYDESERGADSDREELVIDDTPRDDSGGGRRGKGQSADKYDPFAADSDSDDSQHHHEHRSSAKGSQKMISAHAPPLRPPPGLSDFPGLKNDENESIMGDGASIMGDNASIMGDNASIMGDNASIMGDNASIMGDDDYQSGTIERNNERLSLGSRLEPPPSLFSFPGLNMETDMMSEDGRKDDEVEKIKTAKKKEVTVPRIRLTAYDDDDDDSSDADCPNFSIYSSETIDVARHTEQEMSSQIGPLQPPPMPPDMLDEETNKRDDSSNAKPLEPPPMPLFDDENIVIDKTDSNDPTPLEPPPLPLGMFDDDLQSKAGSPESIAPLEPPPMPPMEDFEEPAPLEPPPMPPMDDLESHPPSPVAPLEPPPIPPLDSLEMETSAPLEPPPMPPLSSLEEPIPLEPPPMPPLDSLEEPPPLEPPPLEPPPLPPLESLVVGETTTLTLEPPPMPPLEALVDEPSSQLESRSIAVLEKVQEPAIMGPPVPLEPPPLPPLDDLNLDEEEDEDRPLEPPPFPPSILGDDENLSLPSSSEEDEDEDDEENEDTPVIGPKNRGGRKRSISSKKNDEPAEHDEDVIVGDVQACDLTESEKSEYMDAIQKERQALNKSSGKIDLDSRGKITFKIGNLSRLNKVNLYDEQDESEMRMTLDLERDKMEIEKEKEKEKERDREREKDRDRDRDKDKYKDSKRKDYEKGKHDSKSKHSEKDSKSKSKYDDKRRDKSSKSSKKDDSKSSKDSKGKYKSSKDSKSKKYHRDKSPPHTSGWDIKPRGMTSSESSDAESIESSPVRKESPNKLDSPILLDSPVRSPPRKSDLMKSLKPINIDLDELQQTLDKKLVELEDLNKLHPDEMEIMSVADDSDAEKSKEDTNEDRLKIASKIPLKSIIGETPVDLLDDFNIPVVTMLETIPIMSKVKLTETETTLLEEIEKSCESELEKEFAKEILPGKECEDSELENEIERDEEKAEDEEETASVIASVVDESLPSEKVVEKFEEEPVFEEHEKDNQVALKEPEISDNMVDNFFEFGADEFPTLPDLPPIGPVLPEEDATHGLNELLKGSSEVVDMEVDEEVDNEEEEDAIEEEASAISLEKEKDIDQVAEEDEDDEDDVIITGVTDKSEIIDLDSAEFADKADQEYDLENDGFQIESVTDTAATLDDIEPTTPAMPRRSSEERISEWEIEGGFTPRKENRRKSVDRAIREAALLESDLEPVTPTKDRINDGLDGVRTPAGYAGLGTEAISETDEAMNFEDELALLNMRSRDKDVEEGEIPEDRPRKQALAKKQQRLLEKQKLIEQQKQYELQQQQQQQLLLQEEAKRKRKKERKEKSKEAEKNKENIASENLVSTSAWKKATKSSAMKERQYREKRSKSKDPSKSKKKKETATGLKKKEKRKELPRYDVRRIVAEKPRVRKDAYGRDIRESSRSRSLSLSRERSLSFPRRSRSYTPAGRGRRSSRSRSRSWSRGRRSRSYQSPARRRSLSPRAVTRRTDKPRRRSSSRGRGRSRSHSRSRSRSRSRRRSLSPRRKSRRDASKKRRSRSRSRSRSRTRSRSRSRSRSRGRRREKRKHVSRSRSRARKRSRSKSVRKRDKKHAKRKPSRSRSRSRSLERRSWEHHQLAVADKVAAERGAFLREPVEWSPSWSRSRSKTPPHGLLRADNLARNWSPPQMTGLLNAVNVPPKNLKVILTNKEAIKKKKKEKRKESRKVQKDVEKKRKAKKGRTPPPSKEVFASGDNILVSVCFNKDYESQAAPAIPELPETIPLLPPVKRRRREPLQLDPAATQAPPAKKSKKDKVKDKAAAVRAKSPSKPAKKREKKKSKAAEIAASKKPMAVIDLDQSPFREQTPSPRDIIVLSDDDDKQAQAQEELEEMGTPEQPQESHTPARLDSQFLQGPKTPPEPKIKFPVASKQTNLRPSIVNPLLEDEEEEEELGGGMTGMENDTEMQELMDEQVEEDHELRAQEELESRIKVGPNTPPEPPTSPPTSPDAYDPFDPTKSRSPTPEGNSQEALNDPEHLQPGQDSPLDDADEEVVEETADLQESQPEPVTPIKVAADKPKIISMVTIKRPSPVSNTPPLGEQPEAKQSESPPAQTQATTQPTTQPQVNSFPAINPVLATVAAAVQRSSIFNSATQLGTTRNLLQQQQQTLPRPTLPNIFANSVPKSTPIRQMQAKIQSKNVSMLVQNGSDANIEMSNDNIDMSSPYSPGSSLSDGLFDPPSPAFIGSPNLALSTKLRKNQEKKDAFDALFDASPIVHKNSMKVRMKKSEKDIKKRKGTHSKIGVRMDENQLQILDDLPSSAVEMQVKDKFLKKLNRQERVVEEVKLVLKPHYTKKHVTKEEYKDIMRKAVPKICHNKSGEINPKKIAALIEAYVKKIRSRKKLVSYGAPAANSTTKKPAKTLWS